MRKWLSTIFSGLSKPKSHEIENLRQGLLRIEDTKAKLAPTPKFESIVADKLKEKGWPLNADNGNLAHALDILRFQCELPLNFKNCVKEYSEKSHEFKQSMTFIMDHKDNVFEIAEELENSPPTDLTKKLTIIVHDIRPKSPDPEAL